MTASKYSDRRLEFFQANRKLYLVLEYIRHAYTKKYPNDNYLRKILYRNQSIKSLFISKNYHGSQNIKKLNAIK